MRIFLYQILFSSIIITTSCTNSTNQNPLLEEAFQYHQQSMQTAKEVKAMIQELSTDDPVVKNVAVRLKAWNKNIVEVPGFEHQHDHDHDHHHGPTLKLSPEDMLLVQKEMLDSIRTYKELLNKLQ